MAVSRPALVAGDAIIASPPNQEVGAESIADSIDKLKKWRDVVNGDLDMEYAVFVEASTLRSLGRAKHSDRLVQSVDEVLKQWLRETDPNDEISKRWIGEASAFVGTPPNEPRVIEIKLSDPGHEQLRKLMQNQPATSPVLK